MPDTFDATLRSAAPAFFQLPDAEIVTYFPRSGASRRIEAVVTRSQAEPAPDDQGVVAPVFEVLVRNDSSAGIASDELDTGGDRIELAVKVGGRPRQLRLARLVNHDAGMCLIKASP